MDVNYPLTRCQSIYLSRYSLWNISDRLNSDDIHFVAFKKKQQLRIKGQIGSFIYNKAVGEEANNMLKEMKFSQSFPWI
jgi:hypothetical protein